MAKYSALLISSNDNQLQLVVNGNILISCQVSFCNSELPLRMVEEENHMLFYSRDIMIAKACMTIDDNCIEIKLDKCCADVVESIKVNGDIYLSDSIICLMDENEITSEYFHMSTGSASIPLFNGIYSPGRDTAIMVESKIHNIYGGEDSCSIEIVDDFSICIKISFDHYKNNVNKYYVPLDRSKFSRPPVGWLSWYCFFGYFDEEKTFKILDFADKNLKRFGFEYVQLENWQQHSWKLPVQHFYHNLECDKEKFPNGMKYVADRIKECGLKPGIWIVPLGTGEERDFEEHKDRYLIDDSGKPLMSWSGDYILDPTHPDSLKQIYDMIHTIVNDWGYEYIKVDGVELGGAGYADALYANEDVNRYFKYKKDEPLRDIALEIREAIGKDTFFTSCYGNRRKEGKMVGVANAARQGFDVLWEGNDPVWEGVTASAETIQQSHYVHNIFWFNDPDVLAIRPPLEYRHAQLLTTLYGIAGQMLFLGDIIYELPKDRVEMVRKIMPVENIFPGHIPWSDPEKATPEHGLPWSDGKLKDIWVLHINRQYEQWKVVALINWNESDRNMSLDINMLGLEKNEDYLLYDYWNDNYLGHLSSESIFAVSSQSCMLLCIRKEQPNPQILSINRHITQDSISLQSVRWDNTANVLSGVSAITGDDDYIVTVHTPESFKASYAETDSGIISYEPVNEAVLKIYIYHPENTIANWSVKFVI